MGGDPTAVRPSRAGGPPGPTTLWAIALAGVAALGLTFALGLAHPDLYQRTLRLVLVVWVSVPFVIGGAIAWRQRPGSRFGPLMLVSGFASLLSTLQWSDQALLNTLGQLTDLLVTALWLHVFLAYPSGRLDGRVARVLVVAGYVAAVGLQLVVLMLGGFDPRHLLVVVSEPGAAELAQDVQLLSLTTLSLAGAALLVHRGHRRRPRPRRRAVLLDNAFAGALVMVAALLVAGALGLTGFEVVRLVTFGAVGLAPAAFLVGLLDARLARSDVADMLVELAARPQEDVRGLLARALRDPTLDLAYWLPQFESWADATGGTVALPGPDDDRGITVVEQHGKPLAALVHHPSLRDEPQLVAAVSAAAGIALENGRLQAELQARLTELHGSRARVIDAAQHERRRLERDLHDGAQQRLIALSLDLGLLEGRLVGDEESRHHVQRARREVASSLQELRDIARGIHPAVVSGHGLGVALESVVARSPIPIDLRVVDLPRLPERIEVAAYYVVCEALSNIGKHAHARTASVDLRLVDDRLVVQVEDDGIGGADSEGGSGLRGLADRVEALDGRLRVWTRSAGGTCVYAEIPRCGPSSPTPPSV